MGTVHAFQGNERELVVISLALGPDDLGQSLRFVEDPNLFNVMVTRGKTEIVVVHSFDPADLPAGLLSRYLKHAHEPPLPSESAARPLGWVSELANALRDHGVDYVADYPVAGYTVDLAIGTGAAALGVECEAHPQGPDAHIERHMALRRAGWDLTDAFQSRWLTQPEAAVDRLAEMVLARSLAPRQ